MRHSNRLDLTHIHRTKRRSSTFAWPDLGQMRTPDISSGQQTLWQQFIAMTHCIRRWPWPIYTLFAIVIATSIGEACSRHVPCTAILFRTFSAVVHYSGDAITDGRPSHRSLCDPVTHSSRGIESLYRHSIYIDLGNNSPSNSPSKFSFLRCFFLQPPVPVPLHLPERNNVPGTASSIHHLHCAMDFG